MNLTRLQAFIIHLCLSALIFIALSAVIYFYMYPGVLFLTEGGLDGMKLIAGVDLILGPILTLLTFNPKKEKREKIRDTSCILLLQTVCIVAGMTIVEQNKPIAIIYANNIFYTTTRTQYEMYDIDYREIPLLQKYRHPVKIALDLPRDSNTRRNESVKLHSHQDIRVSINKYLSLDSELERLETEGFSIEEAQKIGLAIEPEFVNQPNNRVFNLLTRYGHYYIIVNTKSGEITSRIKMH